MSTVAGDANDSGVSRATNGQNGYPVIRIRTPTMSTISDVPLHTFPSAAGGAKGAAAPAPLARSFGPFGARNW